MKRLEQKLDRVLDEQERLKDELSELKEEVAVAHEEIFKPKILTLYGFYDVNFLKWWIPEHALFSQALEQYPMFVFGNLNLYVDSRPLRSWRLLAEIRFSVVPLGQTANLAIKELNQDYSRIPTGGQDPSRLLDYFDMGSIGIERAQIEWAGYDWLNVTAGLFLTPYGIWNIDHGSPTRIIASTPFLYLQWWTFFPERQLGLMVSGSVCKWDLNLSYAVTLSNGRSPVASLKDADDDKGIGLRLEAAHYGDVRWAAGLSFYTGDFTDFQMGVQLAPNVDMTRETTVKFREVALGLDASLDWGPWLVRWEGMANWRFYDDQYRDHAPLFGMIPPDAATLQGYQSPGYAPNRLSLGTYGIVAYRLPIPKVNLRPYLHAYYLDPSDAVAQNWVAGFSAGINWRIQGSIVFKIEHNLMFMDKDRPSSWIFQPAWMIQQTLSQLAMAF